MELKEKLDVISNNSFDLFLEESKTCYNSFVPLSEKKKDFISVFMTKSFRKAIMLRFHLKRMFNNKKMRELLKNTNSKETI